jgi:hypothetical protein
MAVVVVVVEQEVVPWRRSGRRTDGRSRRSTRRRKLNSTKL